MTEKQTFEIQKFSNSKIEIISMLFLFLSILIVLDYLTTYYGLCYLNAIELNPIYYICNNITIFFIIKTLLTVIGLLGILYFSKEHRLTVTASLIGLDTFYLIIILSNLYGIYNYC
jgi:hypothetical protein